MQSTASTPTPGSSGPTTSTPTTTSTTAAAALPPPNPSSSSSSSNPQNPPPPPPPFEFPREYHFPPFFTRQPNATTRRSQLEKWSTLIQGWARSRRQFRISITKDGETPLFCNRALGRRLAPGDAREVLEFMRRHEGRAEPVVSDKSGGGLSLSSAFAGLGEEDDDDDDDDGLGGGKGGGGGGDGGGGGPDVYWVYWKTPEEWAHDIEAWVEETAQKGVVFTLYELTEGEDTRGTEFHGLDPEILQKALQVLVKRGKAQIFGQEDQQGVKFF